MSNKDKVLLIFLASFLIIVLGVVNFILPEMNAISQLSNDRDLVKENLLIIQESVDDEIDYTALAKSSNESVKLLRDQYQGLMSQSEVDKKITTLLENAGCTVKKLEISLLMPETLYAYSDLEKVDGATQNGYTVNFEFSGSTEQARAFSEAVENTQGIEMAVLMFTTDTDKNSVGVMKVYIIEK